MPTPNNARGEAGQDKKEHQTSAASLSLKKGVQQKSEPLSPHNGVKGIVDETGVSDPGILCHACGTTIRASVLAKRDAWPANDLSPSRKGVADEGGDVDLQEREEADSDSNGDGEGEMQSSGSYDGVLEKEEVGPGGVGGESTTPKHHVQQTRAIAADRAGSELLLPMRSAGDEFGVNTFRGILVESGVTDRKRHRDDDGASDGSADEVQEGSSSDEHGLGDANDADDRCDGGSRQDDEEIRLARECDVEARGRGIPSRWDSNYGADGDDDDDPYDDGYYADSSGSSYRKEESSDEDEGGDDSDGMEGRGNRQEAPLAGNNTDDDGDDGDESGGDFLDNGDQDADVDGPGSRVRTSDQYEDEGSDESGEGAEDDRKGAGNVSGGAGDPGSSGHGGDDANEDDDSGDNGNDGDKSTYRESHTDSSGSDSSDETSDDDERQWAGDANRPREAPHTGGFGQGGDAGDRNDGDAPSHWSNHAVSGDSSLSEKSLDEDERDDDRGPEDERSGANDVGQGQGAGGCEAPVINTMVPPAGGNSGSGGSQAGIPDDNSIELARLSLRESKDQAPGGSGKDQNDEEEGVEKDRNDGAQYSKRAVQSADGGAGLIIPKSNQRNEFDREAGHEDIAEAANSLNQLASLKLHEADSEPSADQQRIKDGKVDDRAHGRVHNDIAAVIQGDNGGVTGTRVDGSGTNMTAAMENSDQRHGDAEQEPADAKNDELATDEAGGNSSGSDESELTIMSNITDFFDGVAAQHESTASIHSEPERDEQSEQAQTQAQGINGQDDDTANDKQSSAEGKHNGVQEISDWPDREPAESGPVQAGDNDDDVPELVYDDALESLEGQAGSSNAQAGPIDQASVKTVYNSILDGREIDAQEAKKWGMTLDEYQMARATQLSKESYPGNVELDMWRWNEEKRLQKKIESAREWAGEDPTVDRPNLRSHLQLEADDDFNNDSSDDENEETEEQEAEECSAQDGDIAADDASTKDEENEIAQEEATENDQTIQPQEDHGAKHGAEDEKNDSKSKKLSHLESCRDEPHVEKNHYEDDDDDDALPPKSSDGTNTSRPATISGGRNEQVQNDHGQDQGNDEKEKRPEQPADLEAHIAEAKGIVEVHRHDYKQHSRQNEQVPKVNTNSTELHLQPSRFGRDSSFPGDSEDLKETTQASHSASDQVDIHILTAHSPPDQWLRGYEMQMLRRRAAEDPPGSFSAADDSIDAEEIMYTIAAVYLARPRSRRMLLYNPFPRQCQDQVSENPVGNQIQISQRQGQTQQSHEAQNQPQEHLPALSRYDLLIPLFLHSETHAHTEVPDTVFVVARLIDDGQIDVQSWTNFSEFDLPISEAKVLDLIAQKIAHQSQMWLGAQLDEGTTRDMIWHTWNDLPRTQCRDSGLHTVFAAWAHILGLPIRSSSAQIHDPLEFRRMAHELLYAAAQGDIVDGRVIEAFLRGYGFVIGEDDGDSQLARERGELVTTNTYSRSWQELLEEDEVRIRQEEAALKMDEWKEDGGGGSKSETEQIDDSSDEAKEEMQDTVESQDNRSLGDNSSTNDQGEAIADQEPTSSCTNFNQERLITEEVFYDTSPNLAPQNPQSNSHSPDTKVEVSSSTSARHFETPQSSVSSYPTAATSADTQSGSGASTQRGLQGHNVYAGQEGSSIQGSHPEAWRGTFSKRQKRKGGKKR